jgi:predicted nucleic acid-binding protein
MGTRIDSSVLIAWERNQLNLEDQLADSADEDFGVSATTASELLHGVHRASTPAQRRRREAFVEGLLSRVPIVAFDAVIARIHARISAELAAHGTAVGPHDLIIAATAMLCRCHSR